MPDPKEDNHQYSVELEVVFKKDGEVINRSAADWQGLRYDGMVLLQNMLIRGMMDLNSVGIENAKKKGQGEMFEEE